MPTRRDIMRAAAAAGLWPSLAPLLQAADGPRRWRIGACDWSIGQRQKLDALDVARDIGLDGVQVSFDGEPGTDLRTDEARRAYARRAADANVEICSLAMGVLNKVPYATDDQARRWVHECVEVMAKMGQKIVLLAFFGKGDIHGSPELQRRVIEGLRLVAPEAQKAGVVLGLETYLSRDDHLRIIDAVASPAVKVYYDVANSHKMGYDIHAEIRSLAGHICQVHCKENGALLGRGAIDFHKVRASLEAIDYRGWLVIEGATIKGRPVVDCYRDNAAFLRRTFTDA